MADHFALMTGRLLTEASLRAAIHEAFAEAAVASATDGYERPDPSSSVADGVRPGVGRAKSGVMVECRICHEEGDETYMETPCTCKGSLKYAHHRCVQRWCNEKGDTMCEICLQQFTPNYTAPLKLFRHGRNPTNFRGDGERPQSRGTSYGHTAQTAAAGASSFASESSNPKGIIYSRLVAIALMALLMLRDAISIILGNREVCLMDLITLLMFRTAGIVIPVYIILISVTTLLNRCNQQQAVHGMPVLEPGGPGGAQSMPHQRQQHIISFL